MMCMTELHGGVCHRTSTPHKSGNKMKEKKKDTITANESIANSDIIGVVLPSTFPLVWLNRLQLTIMTI